MVKRSKATIAIICSLVICLAGIVWMTEGSRRGQTKLTYSQFLEQVRAGHNTSVSVIETNSGATQTTGSLKDGKTVRTVLPSDYRNAVVAMQDNQVNIEIRDAASGLPHLSSTQPRFFCSWVVWIFLMRRLPNGPRRNIFG